MSRLGILVHAAAGAPAAGVDPRAGLGAWAGSCIWWSCRAATSCDANLALCFPQWPPRERRRAGARASSCTWPSPGSTAAGCGMAGRKSRAQRLALAGDVGELAGTQPTVLFAPHFVGHGRGWTALTQQVRRDFTTHLHRPGATRCWTRGSCEGRKRFGSGRLFGRADGVKTIVAALREGAPLYLLPDMNFGPEESIFVPFYGVPAATVPSLSRFARLGRAKVVPVITRMTPRRLRGAGAAGVEGFSFGDAASDTALMNERLQGYIDTMPDAVLLGAQALQDPPRGRCRRCIRASAPRVLSSPGTWRAVAPRTPVARGRSSGVAPCDLLQGRVAARSPPARRPDRAAARVVHRPKHQRGQVHGEHLARQRRSPPPPGLPGGAGAAAWRGSNCSRR